MSALPPRNRKGVRDAHAILEREAVRRATSVAALIREAIDRVYAGGASDRRQAAAALLDADPMPVEDWATMKAPMLDELASAPD